MGALLASPVDIKSKATEHRDRETRETLSETGRTGLAWRGFRVVDLAELAGHGWPMVQHFKFGLETNIVIPQQRLRALQAIPCALARRLP